MSAPFTPADGEKSRAAKLYDLVLTKAEHEEITYREAEELLDCGRAAAQAAMRDAAARLERDGKQSVRTVMEFGWVVMRPAEHIDESDRKWKRARNQMRGSLRKLTAIDSRRESLTPFERQRFDQQKLRATVANELLGRKSKTLDELAAMRNQGRVLPSSPVPGATH